MPQCSPVFHLIIVAWLKFVCPRNLLSYKETFPTTWLRKAICSFLPPTPCSQHSTQKLSAVSQSSAGPCISLAFRPFPSSLLYAGLRQSRERAAVPSLPVSTTAQALKAGSGLSSSRCQGEGGPSSAADAVCSWVPLASQLAAQTQQTPSGLIKRQVTWEAPVGTWKCQELGGLLFSLFLTFKPSCSVGCGSSSAAPAELGHRPLWLETASTFTFQPCARCS